MFFFVTEPTLNSNEISNNIFVGSAQAIRNLKTFPRIKSDENLMKAEKRLERSEEVRDCMAPKNESI